MRKLILVILVLIPFLGSVKAVSFTAPEVPESGSAFMPVETETFGDALEELLGTVIRKFEPELVAGAGLCVKVCCICLVLALLNAVSGKAKSTAEFIGVVGVTTLLLGTTESMISMSVNTVTEITEYGKLLLPVMTAALAAQGGVTASAALYSGTMIFSAILTNLIRSLLVPMIYVFLALSVANCACGQELLKKLRDFVKWLATWCLKIILYIFTGYIGITGVVSGTTDAAAVKAAKLTISGVVPVVGGILSDASEAVLVSAGLVKNSIGIYGLFAVAAVAAAPFLRTGAHYLLLKATGSVSEVLGTKRITQLVTDFSGAMGLLLAMTGASCLILVISLVCYMRGIG